MINLDLKYSNLDIDFSNYQARVSEIDQMIKNKTGLGNDFLGWYEWPNNFDQEEFDRLLEAGKYINENAEVLLVVGIGGSYLGSRAAIEMIKGLYNQTGPEVIYVGTNMSSNYLSQVVEYVKNKNFMINVISKSGTTIEPAIAFRVFKDLCEKKYGVEESQKRIFATTDKARGALKQLSDQMGYQTFVIPDDIGGRFSVTTAVGLLPMAAAGIDIKEVMVGANQAYLDFNSPELSENLAYQYAVARLLLHKESKKDMEVLISYEPQMAMVAEWWKQLFGESEGKQEKALYPSSMIFSTDLHSLGQYVQEGQKKLFETLLLVKNPPVDYIVEANEDNLDGLNFLAGKSLDWINKQATMGTLEAHYHEGKNPHVIIELEEMSARSFGYMTYFFFVSCAMSAYLLELNPFDQPGVEVYKKNMFRLLGK